MRPQWQVAASVLAGALLLATGLLIVRFAGLLAPISELVVLVALVGTMAVTAERRERDRKLARLSDRANAHAARNSLASDPRGWIDFFPAAVRLTGVTDSLLLEAKPEGDFDVKAAVGPLASRGAAGLSRSEDFQKADRERPNPIPVEAISGWPDARLARLDSAGEAAVYWLYAAPPGDDREAILTAAERLAGYVAQQPGLTAEPRRVQRRRAVDAGLFGSVAALMSRSAELRSSFASLQTATILFDGAGIPVQVNSSMERLLRTAGLQASRVTPVDIGASLAGIEAETAREMLGEIVRHGGDVRLSSNAQIGSGCFTLRANATAGQLLFEAINVTDLHRLASIQTELATDIDARIRNDLAAIELATKLAGDDRLPADRRARTLSMIGQAAERTRATLNELGRLVDASIYANEGEPYPVNLRTALIQAVAATKTARDNAGVEIEIQQPTLTSLVMAEPESLDALLQAMLEVLLSDSHRGTTLKAVLGEGEEESQLIVTGGFGLPAERLAALLSIEDRSAPRSARLLQSAKPRVERWGGSFEATSEAGQGYRFTLRLRKS